MKLILIFVTKYIDYFMKRSLLTALFCILACIPYSIFAYGGTEKSCDDPDEIELVQQQNGEEPTSLQQHSVVAFKTDDAVVIRLSNCYGSAVACITGIFSIMTSGIIPLNGNAEILLDISSLPTGCYSLNINVSGVQYTGAFTI